MVMDMEIGNSVFVHFCKNILLIDNKDDDRWVLRMRKVFLCFLGLKKISPLGVVI